jgi:exopolysaccharide biosynthesis polyprenyl glycosylphosphotransferase
MTARVPQLSRAIMRDEQVSPDRSVAKRLVDLFGATVGLLFTFLLLPFIAAAIRADSPGPILFTQGRVGRHGRRFKMLKFRTMHRWAEEQRDSLEPWNEMSGPIFKIAGDPRVTRVGRLLRRFSLDELPQFWNVLKGEMSLVGTRPPTPEEVEQYELWHYRRIAIRPGITGLWQVSGRAEVKDFDQTVALDLKYIDEWSLWLDLKILLRTLIVVLLGQGAA